MKRISRRHPIFLLSTAASIFSVLLLVAVPTANALVIAPTEADAPLGDAAPTYAVPIDGTFDVALSPIPDLAITAYAPDSTSASAETIAAAGATCANCLGHNGMKWTNYGWYESVGVSANQNTASEVINRQEHHGALLNGQEECYSGGYKWQRASGNIYNAASTGNYTTGKYTAYNDIWTLAYGGHWYDDGGAWSINGEIDICKQF